MELEDLREMDKKEQERVSNIAKKHEHDEKIDINLFYKDFNLDDPHTSYNPISSVDLKPFQLAPFFKNVVLDIKPLHSEDEFKRYYGMGVEKCYELKKEGLFKFRLSNNYIDYHNLDNDYLDLILHDKPPVSNVINRAHGILINKDDSSINYLFHLIGSNEFDFGNFILNDLGLSDPYMISAFDIMAGHSYDIKKIDDSIYKSVMANNFTKLWACGYNEINELFKLLLGTGNGRLDWAFVFSNVYANILSNPILDSINGTQMMHSRVKYLAKDMSIQRLDHVFPDLKNPANNLEFDDSILSSDKLNIMTKAIDMPTLLNSDDLDDFDFKGAINALKTLESIIDDKRIDEITGATQDLQNELISVGNIVKDLQEGKVRKKSILSNVSWGLSSVGVFGSLFGDNPYNWIFGLMGAGGFLLDSAIKFDGIDWILDKLNKFHKDSHLIYMYDNYDKLKFNDLKNPQITLKHNLTKYDDNLTRTYEYYEYLYENIPSIKVWIDIMVQNLIAGGSKVESDNPQIAFELNKMNKEISLDLKLKKLLHDQFLYGSGYSIKKINKTKYDLQVISPHYVRSINESGEIKNYVLKDGEKIECEDIFCLNRLSIIEKNMLLLDTYYPEITKIESRPTLIRDQLEINEKLVKDNYKNYDMIIKIFKESVELCRQLDDRIHEIDLLNKIGLCYIIKGRPDMAINYLNDAYILAQSCMSDETKKLNDETLKMLEDVKSLFNN
ncbi:MAG: tetratricopeptide repeat protein [Methanobrevibacter sp.]|uniref:tetratricopeptide repeat protein n=1 Tax=Methanobrevibacter sp. TaxID=66852 RepID=UPI003F01B3B3